MARKKRKPSRFLGSGKNWKKTEFKGRTVLKDIGLVPKLIIVKGKPKFEYGKLKYPDIKSKVFKANIKANPALEALAYDRRGNLLKGFILKKGKPFYDVPLLEQDPGFGDPGFFENLSKDSFYVQTVKGGATNKDYINLFRTINKKVGSLEEQQQINDIIAENDANLLLDDVIDELLKETATMSLEEKKERDQLAIDLQKQNVIDELKSRGEKHKRDVGVIDLVEIVDKPIQKQILKEIPITRFGTGKLEFTDIDPIIDERELFDPRFETEGELPQGIPISAVPIGEAILGEEVLVEQPGVRSLEDILPGDPGRAPRAIPDITITDPEGITRRAGPRGIPIPDITITPPGGIPPRTPGGIPPGGVPPRMPGTGAGGFGGGRGSSGGGLLDPFADTRELREAQKLSRILHLMPSQPVGPVDVNLVNRQGARRDAMEQEMIRRKAEQDDREFEKMNRQLQRDIAITNKVFTPTTI